MGGRCESEIYRIEAGPPLSYPNMPADLAKSLDQIEIVCLQILYWY